MRYANRACDNGCYCVVVNQAGPAGPETNHAGGIMVFDPEGKCVAESKTRRIEEEMVVCDLDGDGVNKKRGSRCFNLITRRPEIYGPLADSTF